MFLLLTGCGIVLPKIETTNIISPNKGVNNKTTISSPTVSIEPNATLSATYLPITTDNNYISPIYYDYGGGDLPEDIVTSVEYTLVTKINLQMPEFTFNIYGKNVQSYGLTYDREKYFIQKDINKFYRIVIECDAIKYNKELIFPETSTPKLSKDYYGFDLNDWNFDGYLDISLWKHQGGTSTNMPCFFWLWDSKMNKYVNNTELEDLSERAYLKVDKENSQIVAYERDSSSKQYEGYYKFQFEKYVLIKTVDITYEKSLDNKSVITHHVIKELIDGKMQVTKDYYEDLK